YVSGQIDRLDVAYMSFQSVARQRVSVETLLPIGSLAGADDNGEESAGQSQYEFLPSARDILEEVVPASFKTKLFKCFLDAAVSEQVARMIAMKSATESADDMIRSLSMAYNRARQSRITNEIMEIIGGVEALS
ncbi:MAG: F0F1 ATP synthase subunit gamma, partial [Planctomycetes bacterium]|nr:F0F1 ATP synthase subunit gamma [Planctomycetota bacterium]